MFYCGLRPSSNRRRQSSANVNVINNDGYQFGDVDRVAPSTTHNRPSTHQTQESYNVGDVERADNGGYNFDFGNADLQKDGYNFGNVQLDG